MIFVDVVCACDHASCTTQRVIRVRSGLWTHVGAHSTLLINRSDLQTGIQSAGWFFEHAGVEGIGFYCPTHRPEIADAKEAVR